MKRMIRVTNKHQHHALHITHVVRSSIPWALVLILAILIRTYNVTGTIRFRGDHGMDLLIVRAMEQEGHRPLVGPFLSLRGFYTPPTYYYLTWASYHLTKSIEGIVYINVALNILTMLILMRLAYEMAGKGPALTAGLAFAVSSVMIVHARNFWQPYHVQLFLALFLYLLWRAFAARSVKLLWAASASFFIALSVYPSPLVLIPFVCYQVFRWYRTIAVRAPLSSLWHTLLTLALPAITVYMPQIIFEVTYAFPSLRHMDVDIASLPSLDRTLMRVGENAFYFLLSVTRIESLFPQAAFYIALFVLFIYWKVFPWDRIPRTIRSFLSPGALIAGILVFILYTKDTYSHRTWAYFPFAFLFAGLGVSYGWMANGAKRLVMVAIAALYITLNLAYITPSFTNPNSNEMKEARDIAWYVMDDMKAHDISASDMSLFHKIPDDPQNGSYKIYRVLYFLVSEGALRLSINEHGNIPVFDYSQPKIRPHMYVMCQFFPSREAALEGCVAPVMQTTAYTVRKHSRIGTTEIFVLDTRTSHVTSARQ